MGEVVSLTGERPAQHGEPNGMLVRILEDMLDMARQGRLQSFVATGYTLEGNRLALWADAHENCFEMLGAIAALQGEYLARHPALTST